MAHVRCWFFYAKNVHSNGKISQVVCRITIRGILFRCRVRVRKIFFLFRATFTGKTSDDKYPQGTNRRPDGTRPFMKCIFLEAEDGDNQNTEDIQLSLRKIEGAAFR